MRPVGVWVEVAFALLGGASVVATGCRRNDTTPPVKPAGPRESAVRAAADGVTHLLKLEVRDADARFREAIQADQNYSTARVLRAAGMMVDGDDAGAIAELRIVRGTEPRPDCVVRLLAVLYYGRGSMELARDNLEQCVAEQPESAEARFYAALSSRTPEQMRERLDALLEANPEFDTARAYRGRVRAALGDGPGGVSDVLVCVRHRADDASLWWQLADQLLASEAEAPAAFALERVIEIDPGWSTANERLARLLAAGGETARAMEFMDKAIEADSSRRDELVAARESLEQAGAASQSVEIPGDVARVDRWIELLNAVSSDDAARGRFDRLSVAILLVELHAGGWADGLPAAWNGEEIAAERKRIIDDARELTAEVQRLIAVAATSETR
jgi:tetratricopeptide (TPR) repeat protein